MTRLGTLMAGAAFGLCLAAGQAAAGPCADQIDQVSRMMSGGKGAGTLAGPAPGGAEKNAPMPQQAAAAGKESGTLAGNAPGQSAGSADPTGGIATSPQDVRLQQQGMPTAAQGGNPAALDQRMQQAMAAVERARSLDQQGSQDCMAALDEAKRLAGNEQ
jgi:hypothetical protein